MKTEREKQQNHESYERHKEIYKERDRQRRAKLNAVKREAKNRPCADCGRIFPYYVMDFDHVHGKTSEVSDYTKFYNEAKLKEEIAKCDVVCANCHRMRTHVRSGGKYGWVLVGQTWIRK